MKLLVDKHNIELIKEEDVNENEVNVSKCFFEFSSEYNEYPELIKKAIFILKDKAYEMLISNDQCDYPPEMKIKLLSDLVQLL